jgi:hypothetical protein
MTRTAIQERVASEAILAWCRAQTDGPVMRVSVAGRCKVLYLGAPPIAEGASWQECVAAIGESEIVIDEDGYSYRKPSGEWRALTTGGFPR